MLGEIEYTIKNNSITLPDGSTYFPHVIVVEACFNNFGQPPDESAAGQKTHEQALDKCLKLNALLAHVDLAIVKGVGSGQLWNVERFCQRTAESLVGLTELGVPTFLTNRTYCTMERVVIKCTRPEQERLGTLHKNDWHFIDTAIYQPPTFKPKCTPQSSSAET